MTVPGSVFRRILWATLFGIAFAFVESSIVVYLRALYYPEGFAFPLKLIAKDHFVIELFREEATIIMLASVAILTGTRAWEKFGYFIFVFGVWDVFYYLWLKVLIDWPVSLFDWDILFLLPLPWIGPVIAPVLIALLMSVCGMLIIIRIARGAQFAPGLLSWLLAAAATLVILYSFMSDIAATLHQRMPAGYRYEFLAAGILLYIAAFVTAVKAHHSADPSS